MENDFDLLQVKFPKGFLSKVDEVAKANLKTRSAYVRDLVLESIRENKKENE